MRTANKRVSLVCLLTAALSTYSIAVMGAEPERSLGPGPARAMIEEAQSIYAGHDSTARLIFQIHHAGKKDRRQEFLMMWKGYSKGQIEDKTLLFQAYPPAKRGIAFMNWTYREALEKPDDSWLYLPELRTIRKIVHGGHQHGHHHQDSNDDFSMSSLHRAQLTERPTSMDRFRRLPDRLLEGQHLIRIERTPKMAMPDFPYRRTINWLKQDPLRIVHIDYYGNDGKLALSQDIRWQQIGRAWVWRDITGRVPGKGIWTRLKLEDVQVDTGIKDRDFSKRHMRRGAIR